MPSGWVSSVKGKARYLPSGDQASETNRPYCSGRALRFCGHQETLAAAGQGRPHVDAALARLLVEPDERDLVAVLREGRAEVVGRVVRQPHLPAAADRLDVDVEVVPFGPFQAKARRLPSGEKAGWYS